jgi:hypothetical protein
MWRNSDQFTQTPFPLFQPPDCKEDIHPMLASCMVISMHHSSPELHQEADTRDAIKEECATDVLVLAVTVAQ